MSSSPPSHSSPRVRDRASSVTNIPDTTSGPGPGPGIGPGSGWPNLSEMPGPRIPPTAPFSPTGLPGMDPALRASIDASMVPSSLAAGFGPPSFRRRASTMLTLPDPVVDGRVTKFPSDPQVYPYTQAMAGMPSPSPHQHHPDASVRSPGHPPSGLGLVPEQEQEQEQEQSQPSLLSPYHHQEMPFFSTSHERRLSLATTRSAIPEMRRYSLVGPVTEGSHAPSPGPGGGGGLDAEHLQYLRSRSGTVGAFSARYSPLATPAFFPPDPTTTTAVSSTSVYDPSPAPVAAPGHPTSPPSPTTAYTGRISSASTFHTQTPSSGAGIDEAEQGEVNWMDKYSAAPAGPYDFALMHNALPFSPGTMSRIGESQESYTPYHHSAYSGGTFSPAGPYGGGHSMVAYTSEQASSQYRATPSDNTPQEAPAKLYAHAGTTRSDGRQGPPPNRALWIGSLPTRMTNAALHTLFRRWGPLEGTRVLSLKHCAFVNYVNLSDAIVARDQIGGTQWALWDHVVGLGLGLDSPDAQDEIGANENIKIEYARATLTMAAGGTEVEDGEGGGPRRGATSRRAVPSLSMASGNAYSAVARERNLAHGLASASNSIVPCSDKGGVALPPQLTVYATVEEQRSIMAQLYVGQSDTLSPRTSEWIANQLPADMVYDPDRPRRFSPVLPPPPVKGSRRFDPTHLRELRRGLEINNGPAALTQHDVDQCADALLNDLPLLALDYNGNVVVQRLFERASEPIKLLMLRILGPQLARIGCHKNGTWVAQKVLECIPFPVNDEPGGLIEQELALAIKSLAPYTPPLLLDQYGNYVAQGLLRFGPPYTDPIFDAFLEQTWEIAQGRFGARSMRAVLDHPSVNTRQRCLAGLAIVLCAIPLACSSNGTLLLQWLLDDPSHAFEHGRRFALVWDRLRSALADLATHKLGSAILLHIGRQTVEPDVARDLISALFQVSPPEESHNEAEGTTKQADAEDSPDDEALRMVYKDVLLDQVHGSQLIAQLLSAPSLSANEKERYTELARRVVDHHGLVHVPAHRRLTEAVGFFPSPFNKATPTTPAAQAI